MEMRRGRLIDHVQLRTKDLAASKRFYGTLMEVLGIEIIEDDRYFFFDEVWVDEGKPEEITHVHLAFQAVDRETVDRFHAAGLKGGGKDNGAPGEREYHPGYYAAFLIDPDGNNIEAVYHGPHERSADAIVLTWDD
ncbi:VOC family protein [Caulobacter segnis]|uniref:VOC family protein n=1 Tax=Caulobacter segnis TaxID=88688 RepID=UPI00240F0FB8|nr:VOC family protein [Caulobacter segnis]MDG2520104.1 VOC family protein [Caulobacter segnis]